MSNSPVAPAATHLTKSDLINFEAMLREQRSFRRAQLAELADQNGLDSSTAGGLEVATALELAALHALSEIDLALDRLRFGRYGQCVDCGQPVGRDRLEVLPSAARCLPCQHHIGNGRPPRQSAERRSAGAPQ